MSSASKKTERLFSRFQAMYGGRWGACYESPAAVDHAIEEWAEVVDRMNDEQLVAAITWAKTASPWPPSIAEFLHAGLGIDERAIRQKVVKQFLSSWDQTHMTVREIDAAVKVNREMALSLLVEESLQPALENRDVARIGRGA